MKVFAEYFEGGCRYRRNTILQFGNSWDLIGNAVLANPGSAKPKNNASNEALSLISTFYGKYRVGDNFKSDNWYEFSPDSTMRFVEKIFNGWYVGKSIEISGVIQLFNTFNIINKNLNEAVSQIENKSDLLFSCSIYKYFNDKPTYFGFSKKVLDKKVLRPIAMNIFNNSSDVVRHFYNKDFSKNLFYHPMYINQAYNQKHFQKYKDEVLLALVKNA